MTANPKPVNRRNPFLIFGGLRETGIIAFIIGLIAIVSLRSPAFLTAQNFSDVLLDIAILVIVSIGQLLVLLTGGIDLSIGSGIALSGMVVGMIFSVDSGLPPGLALLLGAGIGLVLGCFNGLLVSAGEVPPIIATLGTMAIYRGFVFIISKGHWINAHQMPEGFKNLTRGSILGIPNLIFIALLVSFFFYYFLEHVRSGRAIYAVGSNSNAAVFAGLKVKKIQFSVYALSGLLYGLAGVLWVSRFASAQSDSASGFELQTVAANVIGGASTLGGSGKISGVLLGSFLLGIISNALNVTRISPFWKAAIQGLIILLAVITDTLLANRLQKQFMRRRRA
ncbi:MAG: ABC transporter permease [Bacillota bacterium]